MCATGLLFRAELKSKISSGNSEPQDLSDKETWSKYLKRRARDSWRTKERAIGNF